MDIIEKICSSGHGVISPSYLVIHDTDDPGADANRLWTHWNNNKPKYMAHYVVDWKGVLIHAVSDNRRAYHCGNGNGRSIGLEICVPSDASLYPAVWDNAVEATKTILNVHGWGTDRMVSHKYASDHWGGSDHQDPIEFFGKMGHSWDDFVSAVSSKGVGPTATTDGQQKAASAPEEHTGTGFGGTYRCTVANLNVRAAPSTSAKVVAQYHSGETVTLQDWYVIADGYVWGRYVGGSGNTRYIAVGKPTGGPAADDYLVKGGSGCGRSAGTYRCTGDGVRVRRGPSLSGDVVAKYNRGETVKLDSFVDGDGLTWGSYVGGSGHRNYVAAKYFERC